MSFAFTQTFDLAASPDAVFAVLTDLDQAHRWMHQLVAIESLTPPPLGPGSRWRESRRMFGSTAHEVFRLDDWSPPAALTLSVDGAEGSSRRGRYRFEYALRADGGGTRLSLTTTVDLPGRVAALFAPLLAIAFKAAIRRDINGLAALLAQSKNDPA